MRKYSDKILYQDGAYPDLHEKRVARILVDIFDERILFIAPDRRIGARTPDIKMSGELWEIKSPKGASSRTIESSLRSAVKQSPNVIIDLSRIAIVEEKALCQIERQFKHNKGAKKIKVILKSRKIIDFKR